MRSFQLPSFDMTNVTISKLKEELDKQRIQLVADFDKRNEILKDELLKQFEQTCKLLNVSLQKALDDANEAKKMADINADEIKRIKSTVECLVDTNKVQAAQISDLTNLLEERTNRQLRNTLVFKGIPEAPNEKTWEDTKSVLAEACAHSLPNLEAGQARNLFERAHRSHFKGKDDMKAGRRDIFVKVYDWNQGEKLKENFRKLRSQNSDVRISCDQKYGPRTTARRSYALSIRRNLKQNGEMTSGYIAFPARLMIKTTISKTEKYHMYADYSKLEVTATSVGFTVIPPGGDSSPSG